MVRNPSVTGARKLWRMHFACRVHFSERFCLSICVERSFDRHVGVRATWKLAPIRLTWARIPDLVGIGCPAEPLYLTDGLPMVLSIKLVRFAIC